MTSACADQFPYQMTMSKGARYRVTPRRVLFAEGGTELRISRLLEGVRTLSGERRSAGGSRRCRAAGHARA
jgi:hypothetical protein